MAWFVPLPARQAMALFGDAPSSDHLVCGSSGLSVEQDVPIRLHQIVWEAGDWVGFAVEHPLTSHAVGEQLGRSVLKSSSTVGASSQSTMMVNWSRSSLGMFVSLHFCDVWARTWYRINSWTKRKLNSWNKVCVPTRVGTSLKLRSPFRHLREY